ncbi:MAG TPA: AfsR/SARP family transcriptional regulator, partial [Euzebyales bacterium]|nr:AfsR/SARP family transcriptional regulator [Euzebyales bacterium]
RWEELRLATEEDLVDAQLALGRHAEIVADVEAMVHAQPFRERRWGQLLVCLYRSGRQAEALERYRQVRRLLAEELGVDPSPSLRAVEAGICAVRTLVPASSTDQVAAAVARRPSLGDD